MLYYSLNRHTQSVSFKEAAIQGQAPDKGLYFPEAIPALPKNFISQLSSLSEEEIGITVLKPYVGESIPENVLRNIIAHTLSFPFPLVCINNNIYTLELFHGPTLAFKDVGARFMSQCLSYFNEYNSQPVTVLVATSGDTGGAVASGFLGAKGVEVVILYPAGKVSPIQELQLTTNNHNITAIEISGSFDDCQLLVKQAFADKELNEAFMLTSANSINIARWLPQQLYYFLAHKQYTASTPPVISVPSGNFGNLAAGMLAYKSGLPVIHFIAACNANDTIPRFLNSGEYAPLPTKATLSNAMDVANPSNFIRILEMFKGNTHQLTNMLSSISITDELTKKAIEKVYAEYGYILDPHGAVGYIALENYLQQHSNEKGYFLETAHPIKFAETVESCIRTKIPLPPQIENLLNKKKQAEQLPASFRELKSWLLAQKKLR
jgi:threonine synthase